MADERQNEQESRVSVDDLPLEVRQLADAMMGVNPAWYVHEWLVEQANLTMDLLAVDLLREKVTIEQRIQRLEDLGRRLEPQKLTDAGSDPHQKNLFDCFDLNEPHSLRGLGGRAVESDDASGEESDERHPSNIFLELMPNDNSDDQLIAIACQAVIMSIEHALAGGEPVASLASIFKHTRNCNIEDSETDEALDHLLSSGLVLEVDDDCFILLHS